MNELEPGQHDDGIGWTRAIVSGVMIVAVGLLLTVSLPNAIVTRLTSLSRDGRQDVTIAVFVVVMIGLAWALRRLQARGLI